MTSDHRSTRLRSGPGLSVSATQIDVRRCFFAFQVHFGSDGADAYVLVTYYVQVRRPFHPFLAREIAGRRSGALSARVSLSLRDRARDRGDARAGTTYRVYSTVRGHYPLNKGLLKTKSKNIKRKEKLRNSYAYAAGLPVLGLPGGDPGGSTIRYMSRAVFENAETEWHGSRWTDCRHNRTSCEIQLEDSFDGLAAHGAAVAHVL